MKAIDELDYHVYKKMRADFDISPETTLEPCEFNGSTKRKEIFHEGVNKRFELMFHHYQWIKPEAYYDLYFAYNAEIDTLFIGTRF